MYCGLHGATIIELPGGEIVNSRDIYPDIKIQRVVEVEGKGKYLTYESHSVYQEDISSPGTPALEAPYFLHRLKVLPGDFQNVETDALYRPGTELRAGIEENLPDFRVTLEPAEFIQVPRREARKLYEEVSSTSAGLLSRSVRERLVGATVYIECIFDRGGQKVSGTGTGFLISPHGYLVTNGHVVAPDAIQGVPLTLERVEVTLYSGTDREATYPAKVIRNREKDFDLALLKIKERGLDFLCIEADPVMELQPVIAAGFPGGQMLVFSGKKPNVSFRSGQITSIRTARLPDHFFYEHSAPIEQGNSGGPLVTPHGTIIGVNTFLSGPQQQSRFAISKDTFWGYFFAETAEGKGPYAGPKPEERYSLLLAQINIIWAYLDTQLYKLQAGRLPGRSEPEEKELHQEEAKDIALDSVEALHFLLLTLDTMSPPAKHRRSHAKVREGLLIQRDTVEKMLALIAEETDDTLVGPAKAQLDERT